MKCSYCAKPYRRHTGRVCGFCRVQWTKSRPLIADNKESFSQEMDRDGHPSFRTKSQTWTPAREREKRAMRARRPASAAWRVRRVATLRRTIAALERNLHGRRAELALLTAKVAP